MNYRIKLLGVALMQGEYRISTQSMWPVVVRVLHHLMGIGCLNSKPPETARRGEQEGEK